MFGNFELNRWSLWKGIGNISLFVGGRGMWSWLRHIIARWQVVQDADNLYKPKHLSLVQWACSCSFQIWSPIADRDLYVRRQDLSLSPSMSQPSMAHPALLVVFLCKLNVFYILAFIKMALWKPHRREFCGDVWWRTPCTQQGLTPRFPDLSIAPWWEWNSIWAIQGIDWRLTFNADFPLPAESGVGDPKL